MNKTAIKNFAVWARNKLIADITYKAGLIGVSEKGIAQPLPQSSRDLKFFDIGTKDYVQVAGSDIVQRNALVRAIQEKESTSDYNTAFHAIIEEVAYTWFNRLIAIRFMEVNDYLPSRVRVLSSENPAKNEPDFVTNPFDTDMEFTTAEQDKIMQLKDENKLDELFRMLFIRQCNKLHEILPELFEETNNYTELLLSISFTDSDGVVYHLVHDIDEKDFDITTQDEEGKTPGQVEIIGWMYQYYNIEPKDETFALLKKNVKITKERIPAATQLFTPDWIVRYMVENSLGRLWVEGHPNEGLKENWKYYLEEAEQEASVQAQLEQIRAEYRNLNPEDIKVIDPCMGSGHILVYCFDVLMQIYESQGYTQRDAAQSILENNLFGLDIDKRAAQLAYFAVMMKARQYDRRIFTREIKPHVYAIEESNDINRGHLKYFGAGLTPIERNDAKLQIIGLLDALFDAKEYGSILSVDNYDWELLRSYIAVVDDEGQMSFETIGIEGTKTQLAYLVDIGEVLAKKYHVVTTNPPYMGSNNFNPTLSKYIKDNYAIVKEDLYSCMIERCNEFCHSNCFTSMITMESWMFNTTFEKFRDKFFDGRTVINMIHMPYLGKGGTSLGISFGTTAYIIRKKRCKDYNAYYNCIRYFETNDVGVPIVFPVKNEKANIISLAELERLPGNPMSYWAHKDTIEIFANEKSIAEGYGDARQGLKTSDNERFLRRWYEIEYSKIGFDCPNADAAQATGCKWFPYNKGGKFRKWSGNDEYVIDWSNNGQPIKQAVCKRYPYLKGNYSFVVKNESKYFLEQVTWTTLTSGKLSFRYKPVGYLFDGTGSSIFTKDKMITKYLLGLMNSNVGEYLLGIIGQTMSYEVGMVSKVPVIYQNAEQIIPWIDNAIAICKSDWDTYETSWNFKRHPLVGNYKDLEEATTVFLASKAEEKSALAKCEKRINSFFEEVYNIHPTATDDEYSSIDIPSTRDAMVSLISYAVGCMFGRYSLDKTGLIYAGGSWDKNDYMTFIPDKDNSIPISDEEYFEDDIVARFCGWLKQVYGDETLEENLNFIAHNLGNKGTTSRDVIRNYFLSDFIKDHTKTYQKRPVYWLFDSGKQNGFKALVYMHRWNADTVGNLRVEYLHKMQHIYEHETVRMQEIIDNSHDSREVSKATKRKDKLQKQLKETKDYDAKLAHIALSRIEIDLDDGVKVNYEKVQTGRDGKKMQILAKI